MQTRVSRIAAVSPDAGGMIGKSELASARRNFIRGLLK